jgi:NAD(P)-dependent dehydrogenase (short-subunit alcohol dehydrogenase family)
MAAHDPVPLHDAALRGRLTGRRIIVTGAASGIGRAVAELFLRAGASVAAFDRNLPAALDASPARTLVRAVDITQPDLLDAAVCAAADTMGGIDGLVNAAGIANTDWADAVSLDDWKHVLDVNLTGTFSACRACLPHLRAAGGGTIVNLSSGQGLQPFKQRSAYAASKAGVIAFSKCIAMEWAPIVRVNTICPGAVDTPMVRAGYSLEALRTQVGPRYALERIGEPHEIAQAALYLTSTESSFVTGIVLAVDGGRSYH